MLRYAGRAAASAAVAIVLACTALAAEAPISPSHKTEAIAALVRTLPLSAIDAETEKPTIELLNAISLWLTAEFDLPPIGHRYPNVVIVPAGKLVEMRYGSLLSSVSTELDRSTEFEPHDLVALYEDASETIYVLDGWSGRTSAELSVVVHEMVHHVQNISGTRFVCAEEREKLAFEAQQRWLAQFNTTLEREFEIDDLTLLVRTHCFF